ncbi:MAG: EAL domain-containing protein [Candidatus Cloacimonetes bacterium]|nr:EAL domain-containing protein [Candidatus Cloacimonadota bacterium]
MAQFLIIDDDISNCKITQEILETIHPDSIVNIISNAEDYVAKAEELKPDLILLDLHLQKLSGTKVCRELKANPLTSIIPVIIITGTTSSKKAKVKAFEAGAEAFLNKPFEINEFAAQTNVLLNLKKNEDSLRKKINDLENDSAKQKQQLTEQQETWKLISLSTNDGIWEWNIEENKFKNTELWRNTLGIKNDEIKDIESLYELVHPEDILAFEQTMKDYLNKKTEKFELEFRMQPKDSTEKWVLYKGVAEWNSVGEPLRIVGTQLDISDRKKLMEKLEHLAHRDNLTNLPNRNLFYDRLKVAIAHGRRFNHFVGMLFIDLDGFKKVNDKYGHKLGDMLLKEVAIRLEKCIRDFDTVARLGGDEFAVILQEIKDENDCAVICRRILQSLSNTFEIAGESINISASIGISLYPSDSSERDELLNFSDFAMYKAKNSGKNSYVFYSKMIEKQTKEKHNLERQLTKAILNKEFKLFYQPIIELEKGDVVGLEALLRWDLPGKGLLMPEYFMDYFQKSGLIVSLNFWMLKEIAHDIDVLEKNLKRPLRVSINFSEKEFFHPNLFNNIKKLLERNEITPQKIVLELKEEVLFNDLEKSARIIKNLNSIGIGIAIDNFGTGSLSFKQFSKLKIDFIKIDLSFIQKSVNDPFTRRVIAAIRSMAFDMGIKIIAEGVETTEQLDLITILKYDEIQGFLFSQALPVKLLPKVISQNLFSTLSPESHKEISNI